MNNVKICDHSKNTEIVSKGERLWNIMPIKQATFGGSWTMYWYAGWTRWLRWTTKISWRYSSVLRLCSYSGWILRRKREFLHLDFWMDRVEENLGITGFLGSENRKSHCLFLIILHKSKTKTHCLLAQIVHLRHAPLPQLEQRITQCQSRFAYWNKIFHLAYEPCRWSCFPWW